MGKNPQDRVDFGGKTHKKSSPAEKPISLKPLKFEEAVADLLRVKPDDKKPSPAK